MKEYILKKKYPIKLDNNYGNTFLLIYEDNDQYEVVVRIVEPDFITGIYKCIYQTKEFGKDVKFLNHKWDLTGSYVLVLYENTGSGGFLTYKVLGYRGNKIIQYVSEKMIIFGSVFFKEKSLIRVTCNQYWVWKRIHNNMTLTPYHVPKLPGAEVIEYSLEAEGKDEKTYKVIIDQPEYKVPVGKIIQIIRKDFNDITGNLRVWSNNDCMKFLNIKYGYSLTSKCATTITIQLTAGAYNWDSAKEIKVEAR
ncbi:hypothetical protein OW763_13855 [Clostridium aestuarii]|uniref:Uncharacterized protein n=1 Tax=Clostridium aestuarii TaxID=338193 RepID=A0ABT4D2D9_9CLOT|nr:hypothetical protein [Clostridium aestuarii]MCY6485416.1 hypothetical protein [Clostridium aestuarii]